MTQYPSPRSDNETPHSSPVTIAAAWLIVLLPAAWGIYLTAMRAAKLFQ
jgi:hypothetical protein